MPLYSLSVHARPEATTNGPSPPPWGDPPGAVRVRLVSSSEREVALANEEDRSRRGQPGSAPDLRPIVSRLEEIRRKCNSLQAHTDETRDASARLDAVIDALKTADQGAEGPQPLPYRELARRLFPVQRMFETLGFPSVARELTYVEKGLEDLDPAPAEPAPPPPAGAAHSPRRDALPALDEEPGWPEDEDEPAARRRRSIPGPIAAMLMVLVLVILGAIVVVQLQSEHRLATAGGVLEPTAAAVAPAPAAPAPTPAAPPTPAPSPTETEPHGAAVVAEEIAQARLALAEGNLDRAIHHVSQAALVDLTSSLVLDTGQTIVRELLARSDGAAEAGHWDDASRLVERARELSIRFGFPLAAVDATRQRHASMERFQIIDPTNREAVRAAVGRRVLLLLADGHRRDGRIEGVAGDVLRLERYRQVGNGGRVYYTEDVPLGTVREIRAFED